MKIHFMTWNTELYKYCKDKDDNFEKEIKENPDDERIKKIISIIDIISKHMEKENAVAVLQEIPLNMKRTGNRTESLAEHPVWKHIKKFFPENDYDILYNKTNFQIKMTVVIAKKGIIEPDNSRINLNNDFINCFVAFKVKNTENNKELHVLAVHQGIRQENGKYASDRINGKPNPNIILGDFNAGDYEKLKETEEFKKNKENYKKLLNKGYTDICEGKNTTKYKTAIDHVLVDDDKKNATNCKIRNDIELSDHYPITFTCEL